MNVKLVPPSASLIFRLRAASIRRVAGFLLLVPLVALMAGAPRAQAQMLTFLHNFGTISADDDPNLLVRGSDGNFYGTTSGDLFRDGDNGYGTVFQITPAGVLKTLYTFTGGSDGEYPTGLVQGSDGNLYGSTGTNSSYNLASGPHGTVFRVTPTGVLTTLYTFSGGSDGTNPTLLLQGRGGNFYGVTKVQVNEGTTTIENSTLFRITPTGALTTLRTFSGGDGANPNALVQGSDGNFYGTTADGGASGCGTIFRLTVAGALTTLYSFDDLYNVDGNGPNSLVQGNDGNFYGTTSSGGDNEYGTVFRLTPAGGLTILHSFTGSGDGADPSGLVQGSDGNFYGVTEPQAGTDNWIFSITPSGDLSPLSAFWANGLVQGSDGSFYGTSPADAQTVRGTVFRLTVPGVGPDLSPFFTGEVALNNGVYYLTFPNGNDFGYYSFLTDPHYLYHFDLGYEYVFDAADGHGGAYLYDFKSRDFFYTSPSFPFPYLYDFGLNAVLYYYPDPNNAGHYNTNGVRYFYDFATGEIISK